MNRYCLQLSQSFLVVSLCFGMTALTAQPVVDMAWAYQLGGAEDDYSFGSAVAPNGNLVVGSVFRTTIDFAPGPLFSQLTSMGGFNTAISIVSPTGNLIGARQFGGGPNVIGTTLAVGSNGQL